jgi:hypothetical protein
LRGNELQAVTDTASDSGGHSAARAATCPAEARRRRKTPRRALDRPSGGSGSETSGNARAGTGTPAAACATFPLGVRSSHAGKSGAHSPPPQDRTQKMPEQSIDGPIPNMAWYVVRIPFDIGRQACMWTSAV